MEQRLSNACSAQLGTSAAAAPKFAKPFTAIKRMEAMAIARTFTPESIQTRAQETELDPCLAVGSHFRPTGNRPALPQERTPYSAEDLTPPRQVLPIAQIGKPCLHVRAHDLFPVTLFVSRNAPAAVGVRRRSRLCCCSWSSRCFVCRRSTRPFRRGGKCLLTDHLQNSLIR